MESRYDAVVLVSFGGPEKPDDVMPFLRNVTAGRDVPSRRLETVARQYQQLGGASPHNEQCRRLQQALADELTQAGHDLPVYWGNRNWKPFLADTVATMAADGRCRVLAVVTSAFSSYPGCRQYLDDIASARAAVGEAAPVIDKVRAFYDHPGLVEPFVDAVVEATLRLPESRRGSSRLVFTAHSIPLAMARVCQYEQQLRQTAGLVTAGAGHRSWDLVWQSRSSPESTPWLEPDISDHLRVCARDGHAVVLAPIGFVSDHMEVIWDLDVVAAGTAAELGIPLVRAVTPGTLPDTRFVAMLRELVEERLYPGRPRRWLGTLGPGLDSCTWNCCR